MPLDLKEPEGWRLSSLRKILLLRFRNPVSQGGAERETGARALVVNTYHPAALERGPDSIRGVVTQG